MGAGSTSIIVACLLGACGATASTPLAVEEIELPPIPQETLRVQQSFFIPGEQMSFDLSLRGVLGGQAVVAVGEAGEVEGHKVVIVRSRVESAGMVAVIKEVRDEVITWIDIGSGAVIKHRADSKFGEKQALVESDMGGGVMGPFDLDYQRDGAVKHRVRQMLPGDAFAYDVHASIGVVRAWQGEVGDEASTFILSGRRLWRNSFRVGARETIRTALGKHPAIRIDGVAQRVTRSLRDEKGKKPRHYSVWISDDGNRLPLLVLAKTEFGELRAEMTDYVRPDERLSSR